MDEISLAWTRSDHFEFLAYELWRWSGLALGDRGRWRSPWPWVTLLSVLLALSLSRRPGRRRQSFSLALAAASLGVLILSSRSSAEDEPGAARVGADAQHRGSSDLSLPPTAQLILRTEDRGKLEYLDKPLRPGTPYSYQLFVLRSDGVTSASNIAEGETLPLPTATPSPTATVTPTVTATPTVTPCPESQRTLIANGIGVGPQPYGGVNWTISDDVVETRPRTLAVSQTLCWQNSGCEVGQTTVGPAGAPPRVCIEQSDCVYPPIPDPNAPHAAFFYQHNNGPPRLAGGDPNDPSLPPYAYPDIPGLKRNSRLHLNVNDSVTNNNAGGFRAELRYMYRDCSAGP
jgi:hypothetical protein